MKVLDTTLPSPAENLACDEALLDAAESGDNGEVLRFWESREYFVVVGYANKIETEVNVAACKARGIPILRRCTGGGTVLQGPGCLSYALVLRITHDGPTRSISAANEFIMGRNCGALARLAPDIQIRGHTDLAIGGLKCSGNSQRRRKHFLLFHGTFLLNFDLALVSELLPMPTLQPEYRDQRTHNEFITNLRAPAEAVKKALCHAWNARSGVSFDQSEGIQTLVDQRYSRREWNWKF